MAILFAFALIAAACGDDDDGAASDDGAAATDDGAAATDDGAADDAGADGAAADDAGANDAAADDGGDEPAGDGSADLGPMKVGVINSVDLFGDYSGAIEAAAEYVNAELGGLDGREIEISVCAIDYGSPDDTQRCANELAANEVEFAISPLNQFGNHFEILRGAGIPVLVGAAVALTDYTTEGVFAPSPGGGCPGTLTAMTKYAVQELGAKRIAVPYYDIPSGALCFYDNEQKPLDILRGDVPEATSPDAGSVPDLEYEGIPAPPGGDLTATATQILDFEPEAIIYSGPATECFPLVSALTALGWTQEEIPFVMTTSCFDQTLAEDGGDATVGIYFVGGAGYLTADPATLGDPAQAAEAETYQTKAIEYGLDEEFVNRSFAQAGFTLVMSMDARADEAAAAGNQVTGQALADAFAATENSPQFGSTPISCSSAPAPYITLCNRSVSVTQWNGTGLDDLIIEYYGMDLLEGTEIRTPPA